MNRLLAIVCTVGFCSMSAAQENDTTLLHFSNQEPVEALTEETDDSHLTESLEDLHEYRLDLNTATSAELTRLPWVTTLEAEEILAFRREHEFETIEDLLNVPGFSRTLVEQCRPYFFVAQKGKESGWRFRGTARSRLGTELQARKGFLDGTYEGEQIGSLTRLHISGTRSNSDISSMEIGLTNKKDPGERLANGYASFYLGLASDEFGLRAVLGDYALEFAEGLVLWRSFASSKGSEVFSPMRKNGSGLKANTSTDETWSLHGAAVEWGTASFSLTAFVSDKKLSATRDSAGNVTSIYASGLFRSAVEESKRDVLRERLYGVRSLFNPFTSLRVGATVYSALLSSPIFFATNEPLNSLTVVGVDLSYTTSEMDLFSENARDASNNNAWIAGAMANLSRRVRIGVVARSYAAGFQNLRGFAFSENSGPPDNEEGIYLALRVAPIQGMRFSFYTDEFQSKSASGTILERLRGNDLLINGQFAMSRALRGEIQFKEKSKPIAGVSVDEYGRDVRPVESRTQQNVRATLETIPSPRITWKTRAEVVSVSYSIRQPSERGYLIYQDVRCEPDFTYSLSSRLIVFRTDSFDSRVYEFESDLPGAFSNPALFGSGLRWYILLRFALAEGIQAACKYSYEYKDGVRSLGSGSSEILGSVNSRLSLQIDGSF